ncbi:unnamed protein product [Aspergillus oryzae]|nr:unnamed protein product [Aspergillus oryzae]GMG05923.1 unnamed protein product [Aspergillus oryzae]
MPEHEEDLVASKTEGFKVGEKKTINEYTELALEVEGRPDVVIDVSAPGAVDTLKDKPFTIKEGAHFRIKVVFQVHHEVLSGLKYLQVVKRKGVRVSKDEEMLGSYAPNTTDKPVYEKKCKFPLPLVQSAVNVKENNYKRVSQKVVNHRVLSVLILLRLLFVAMGIVLRGCVEDVEKPLAGIANFEDARKITASIAVVRCTPHGTEPVIVENLIPLLTQLVRPQNMGHAIDFEEFPDNLRTECIPSSPWRKGELISFGIRVGPDQIGHGAFMRDLTKTVNDFNLVYGVDGRG